MAVLKVGSKGPEVKRLQELLNKKLTPNPNLVADGIFGKKTEAAVKAFQKANQLTVDGLAGPNTMASLEKRGNGKVVGNTAGVTAILVQGLKAVADHYGVIITVTSGKRNPTDQARAMWNNWKTNLREGAIYVALRQDKATLQKLRNAYDSGDRATFDSTVKQIAPKLSRHLSGDAVDVKKSTNNKAVKAMASMFHHVAEKTCHHFDTKKRPGKIDGKVKARWPK